MVFVRAGELREEFESLREANAKLPEGARVAEEEFNVDPELLGVLQAERDGKIEAAVAEVAWAKEKSERQLKKLKERFIGAFPYNR